MGQQKRFVNKDARTNPGFVSLCKVTGKRSFLTKKAVKIHIRRDANGKGNKVYSCAHCGMYHFGHQYGKDRQFHRELMNKRVEENA